MGALNSLPSSSLAEQVRHLAPLLGRLIELISAPKEDDDVRERAFQQLLRTLDTVATLDDDSHGESGAMRIVAPYVRAVFGCESARAGTDVAHIHLTRLLVRELRAGADHLARTSRAIGPLLLLIYKVMNEISCAQNNRNPQKNTLTHIQLI